MPRRCRRAPTRPSTPAFFGGGRGRPRPPVSVLPWRARRGRGAVGSRKWEGGALLLLACLLLGVSDRGAALSLSLCLSQPPRARREGCCARRSRGGGRVVIKRRGGSLASGACEWLGVCLCGEGVRRLGVVSKKKKRGALFWVRPSMSSPVVVRRRRSLSSSSPQLRPRAPPWSARPPAGSSGQMRCVVGAPRVPARARATGNGGGGRGPNGREKGEHGGTRPSVLFHHLPSPHRSGRAS